MDVFSYGSSIWGLEHNPYFGVGLIRRIRVANQELVDSGEGLRGEGGERGRRISGKFKRLQYPELGS